MNISSVRDKSMLVNPAKLITGSARQWKLKIERTKSHVRKFSND